MRAFFWAVCAILAAGPSLSALTQAKIKRGPSYRESESSYGGAIHLDRGAYSPTGRIRVTVIAPDANLDPRARDLIGDGKNGEITIKTRKARLENYRLVETGADTGIFYGYVTLTGFAHDADGDGVSDVRPQTGGAGPYYGKIAVDGRRDGLSVYWKPASGGRITQYADLGARVRSSGEEPKAETATVSVGWRLGTVAFDSQTYPAGGAARIRVYDPDMNLDPDRADRARLYVFSESDIAGVNLTAEEIRNDIGVFEAKISFTASEPSNGARLRAKPGDRVYALYTDSTLPKPYGQGDARKLRATARMSSYGD